MRTPTKTLFSALGAGPISHSPNPIPLQPSQQFWRRLSVCLSMSYPQTTTASGILVACAFRPIRPPRLASLFLSSPFLSFLILVCSMIAEQSNSTKSNTEKSKAKKSKSNERRLSVCLSASYPQTTTTSGIQVACTFPPIRPSSPRLALPLFSSPLLS